MLKKYPNCFPFSRFFKESLGVTQLPPVTAMLSMGKILVSINSVELLQDMYFKKNAYATKHWIASVAWTKLMPHSILFQDTDD
jgi:hypothetical protein